MHKTKHPLWNRWIAFRNAIENPNNYNYWCYGERGIDYDPRWRNFELFVKEIEELIGPLPPNAILERIDNDRGYWPDNVKWATPKENHNNRRSNHNITFNGKTQSISDWQTETGINESTIWSRLNDYGWPVEAALTLPKNCKYKK